MYCDYAATTPLSDGMKEYLTGLLDDFGNPSSLYSYGDKTRKIVESARQSVRRFINAPTDSRVIFTPSGSGSNMLAVNGFLTSPYHRDYMTIYSPLLHKSLNEFVKNSSLTRFFFEAEVDSDGRIMREALEQNLEFIKKQEKRPFVIVEYANSEIGTIQNISDIAEMVHSYYGTIYVDCTGAISSVSIDVQDLGVDMIGFSAHKLGALKGCGVLWVKNTVLPLSPLIYGAQEDGMVGGTENVLGIGSLGYAIENHQYRNFSYSTRATILQRINDYGWKLAGHRISRLPNSFYFCIPGESADGIMINLDLYHDIQVSTGSACSSGDRKPSSALKAIRVPEEDLFSYIRLSFHGDESLDDVLAVLDVIKEVADEEV